jgi:hypothetical protein
MRPVRLEHVGLQQRVVRDAVELEAVIREHVLVVLDVLAQFPARRVREPAREARRRKGTEMSRNKAKQSTSNPSVRDIFIRALAEYLVGNAALSIKLEMGDPAARLWAKVRGATPLSGYPTVDEAVSTLTRWFDGGMKG